MAAAIRYFIYARKSTDVEDKQARSIDAQLSELHDFAIRNTISVVEVIVERESAKTPGKRRQFNAMLNRIERGEAGGILAWHPDRLARNMTDGGRLIDLIDTGKITALRFPTFWFEATPQGKFMLGMAFSQSKYYVDALAENTRRGLREKVRRGEYPAQAPLGYLNDRRVKRIIVDRNRAPLVVEMFERFATSTTTISNLQEYLADRGIRSRTGKLVPNTTVTHILKNPIYYGHFRYDGDIYEGTHEPIISKKLFDEVQTVFKKRWRYSPAKSQRTLIPLLGLMRCAECGCAITAEVQKGHTYYRCTKKRRTVRCTQPYVREEVLDAEVSRLLRTFILPAPSADGLLDLLARDQIQSANNSTDLIAAKRLQIKAIREKIRILLDMRLNAEIDAETYTSRKSNFMSRTKTLEDDLAAISHGHHTWLEPLKNWILDAKNLPKTVQTGSLTDKKDLAKKIFGSNLCLDRKKARGSAANPWSLIPENSLGDTLVHLYYSARTYFQRTSEEPMSGIEPVFEDQSCAV
jgi:site-specific DNA recombinase